MISNLSVVRQPDFLKKIIRRAEPVTIRLDPAAPSAEFLRACFAAVFASLDERPRRLAVDVFAENAPGVPVQIDVVDGEPLFRVGDAAAQAVFRRRWLPEHPVPLNLNTRGATRLLFLPASGNRVKVRPRRWGAMRYLCRVKGF